MIRKRTNYVNTTDKKGKVKYLMPCYGINDIYKYYRKDVKKRKPSKENIKFKLVRDVLDSYNKKLVEVLINGEDVHIPNSLGILVVRKRWLTTDYYRNASKGRELLGDGKWIPKIKLVRLNAPKIKNLFLYSFGASGLIKNRLRDIFKPPHGHKKYFEL